MQAEEIQIQTRDDRTGLDVETLKQSILNNLFYIQGKFPEIATLNDYYMALGARSPTPKLAHYDPNLYQGTAARDMLSFCRIFDGTASGK